MNVPWFYLLEKSKLEELQGYKSYQYIRELKRNLSHTPIFYSLYTYSMMSRIFYILNDLFSLISYAMVWIIQCPSTFKIEDQCLLQSETEVRISERD